jgi:hypothetical protein
MGLCVPIPDSLLPSPHSRSADGSAEVTERADGRSPLPTPHSQLPIPHFQNLSDNWYQGCNRRYRYLLR